MLNEVANILSADTWSYTNNVQYIKPVETTKPDETWL
jgi:hypothetical protein